MKQNSGRKKRRKLPTPKLGWQDKLLYGAIYALVIGSSFGVILLSIWLYRRVAFSNPGTVAVTEGAGSFGWFYLLIWCLAVVIFVSCAYDRRTPIFGRKDIRYGPPQYAPVYPLLKKDKPYDRFAEKKRSSRRKWALTALISLAFSLLMTGLSVCGRSELHQDGAVVVYNQLNRQTETYDVYDIFAVELSTCSYKAEGSPRRWSIEMEIEMLDGKHFEYALRDFAGNTSQALDAMLQLRQCYGRLVTVEGIDRLPDAAADQRLNAHERELLDNLFGQ